MKKYLSIFILLFVAACNDGGTNNPQDGSISSSSDIPSSSSSDITLSSSSFEMEVPQMDERVVAYRHNGGIGKIEIITDMDLLNRVFKGALNDPECDYFEIYAPTDHYPTYFVVSKDQNTEGDTLVLYHIYPSLEQPNAYKPTPPVNGIPNCGYDASTNSFSFLICDKNGGLKDRVHFSPPVIYYHPNWDCWRGPRPDDFYKYGGR